MRPGRSSHYNDPTIPKDRNARLALLRRGLIPWLAGIDSDTGSPRRRVARKSEIPEEARPLIEHLVDQRLLATDISKETGEQTIEPVHEALLRQWSLLQGWLAEDAGLLAVLEGVKRASRDWDANNTDSAWLTHATNRLQAAEQRFNRTVIAKTCFQRLLRPWCEMFFHGILICILFSGLSHAGATLDAIRARQHVLCGVDTSLRGFSVSNANGEWTGFDVDICRAIAAAVLGDPVKVKFVPTRTIVRFDFLRSGQVDVLSRNTTWTMGRETEYGISFVATVFYDGQGFLVSRKYGAKSARELDGATVCVQPGTTTELNLKEYFLSNNMKFKSVVYETSDEVSATLFSGRCEVLTTDASKLAIFRDAYSPKGRQNEFVILPEIVSKEPLAPAVRKGDAEWRDVVKWTVFALIEAEEYGITQSNVELMAKQSNIDHVRAMLGAAPAIGDRLGLKADWLVSAIKAVGNYEEIWARNFEPLGLPHGRNKLWSKGGLLYAPPLR